MHGPQRTPAMVVKIDKSHAAQEGYENIMYGLQWPAGQSHCSSKLPSDPLINGNHGPIESVDHAMKSAGVINGSKRQVVQRINQGVKESSLLKLH